jgi:ATP-dependent DNA helicase RecG
VVFNILKPGESRTQEFKRTYSSAVLKTVSAFANFHDGTIIFGIEDDGSVIGIDDTASLRLQIENAINDNLRPIPEFSFEIVNYSGKSLLFMYVFHGFDTPYYFRGRAYMRLDTSSSECDRIRLQQLILAGQNIGADELETSEQNLSFTVLSSYLKGSLGIEHITPDLMRSLELIRGERYTAAAALLSDSNPTSNSDLILLVTTEDGLNIRDRRIIRHKSLLTQYEQCLFFRDRNLRIAEHIAHTVRETIDEIPETAYREAVANALIHRDYMHPGQIKLELTHDKLYITSPGSLPPGISPDEYLAGRISLPRNRVLADIFMRLGLIEKLATGIRRIRASYSGRPVQPEFLINQNSLTVVLPRIQLPDYFHENTGGKLPLSDAVYSMKFDAYVCREENNISNTPGSLLYEEELPLLNRGRNAHLHPENMSNNSQLSNQERQIIELLQQNNQVTRKKCEELSGLGKTRTWQLLRGLIDKNIVYTIQAGKNTCYRLSSKV